MHNFITLTTPRLHLLKITPSIIHNLFDTETKETIINLFGCDENYYTKLLDMHHQGMESYRISMCTFLLQNIETGITMGECGFHTWNATHKRAEIFYALNKEEYKRQGFMTEALQAVLNYAYQEMDLHRIAALIDDNNLASKRLLEHYGFTREGIARQDYVVNGINEDSIVYSLLKQEHLTKLD